MLKIEKPELSRIWQHFQRFALYDDLTDLNDKITPSIVRFENKILQFKKDQENSHLIIKRFDEVLNQKLNKVKV